MNEKICYIIAGPNGAGKTTFANEFLPTEGDCLNFINADLIAKGLSPFQPEKVALKSGKLMIQQMNEVVSKGKSFAVETTFSGMDYSSRINNWKSWGYYIVVYYLKLRSVELAIERVKLIVLKGGHNITEDVIRRRYERSWRNFQRIYKHLSDVWTVFDNSGQFPVILDESASQEDET